MTTERPLDDRDARVRAMPMVGAAGLAALRSSTVAVLGVGNIGGFLAQHLVLLGVSVVLIDRDAVERCNLGTQAFAEEQVGSRKVEARARWLRALNPSCSIETVDCDIADLGLGALRSVDLICCCLDTAAIRILVNEIAVRSGVPWIDAAIDGSGNSFFGRVAAYDPRDEQCGCYLCPHTSATVAQLVRDGAGRGCATLLASAATDVSAPTLAVSALGAAAAAIQAAWALSILLHRDARLAGRETYFDLDAGQMTTHRLRRNRRCVFDHARYELDALEVLPAEATIGETFDLAERRLGEPVTLELQHRAMAAALQCSVCGARRHSWRIARTLRDSDCRCDCGGLMHGPSHELVDRFRREDAAAFLHRTWREIGLPRADVVVASTFARQVHLLVDGDRPSIP